MTMALSSFHDDGTVTIIHDSSHLLSPFLSKVSASSDQGPQWTLLSTVSREVHFFALYLLNVLTNRS